MLNNDILRSVCYILKANSNDLVRILALGDVEATAEQIAIWLHKEDKKGFRRCPDIILSPLFNGLIYEKRGKGEFAPALEPERRINNSIVLKKLRITFSLKTGDILAILTERQFRVSTPGVTAMMRAPDHKSLRGCDDQFLRHFLRGPAACQRMKESQGGYGNHARHGRRQIISLF